MDQATKTLLAQTDISGGGFIPSNLPNDTSAAELADATRIETLFSSILGLFTIVGGLAFLIFFIIGGLNWITAGGDQQKVDAAKKYMTNGVIGLIIVVAAYSIISIVGTVLGFDILNPSDLLDNLVEGGSGSAGSGSGGAVGSGGNNIPI